jgi:hypothetical protein
LEADMATLTLRNPEDDVARRLRVRAAEHGRSSNCWWKHGPIGSDPWREMGMEAATGPDVALVVDDFVGLTSVLPQPDRHLALAPASIEMALPVPDFWPDEICNVLWLQVGKQVFTQGGGGEGLASLRPQVEPTPTAALELHDVGLEGGLRIDHSTCDALFAAFAVAMGAKRLVDDGRILRDTQTHPHPAINGMPLPPGQRAVARGIA